MRCAVLISPKQVLGVTKLIRGNVASQRLRLLGLALIAAGVFGAFPALAGGPNYGTWTYAGSGKRWHGTFSYGKPVEGFSIQTKALRRNAVVSFVIGGKKGHLDPGHGGAYVNFGTPKKVATLTWKLTVTKPLTSSKLINACITTNGYIYHCRLGVP